MGRSLARLALASAFALVLTSSLAFGQGSTSSITGTVVDNGGGVIPGATVEVVNQAGAKFNAVTNGEGVFTVPALTAGTYKVSVTLSGFKTWASAVQLAAGIPTALKVTL